MHQEDDSGGHSALRWGFVLILPGWILYDSHTVA